MKRGKILATLTLAFTLGIGATAFAASDASDTKDTSNTTISSQSTTSNTTGIGLRRITGKRGYDYTLSIAKDMLKMDDEAINEAKASNKTIYDLLEENGISHDEFKAKLIESKEKAIDEAAKNGSITQEEATTYKETIKNNAENSVPGQGKLNNAKGNRNSSNGNGVKNGSYNGQGNRSGNRGSSCTLNN